MSLSLASAALCLGLSFGAVTGCHAQVPAAGAKLPAELNRRVEILIRQKLGVPPNYSLEISGRSPSEVAGFDQIAVVFTADGKSSPAAKFLLSTDGNQLAQLNKYDLSKNPKELVSDGGRPWRGGPASAPVLIVGFDDLECPYCAKMNAQLFPAITKRYGDNVHFVYRDFPISQHPWAMRAAVDTSCVAAQSSPAYWSLVDYIHAHAGEMGGEEKTIAKANAELDRLAREEAKRNKLDEAKLNACIEKQDHTAIDASLKLGESLGVEATPVLFINGEKLEGAYPLDDVFRMIDGALVAAGQTPPPPATPTVLTAPAPAATPATSSK
ncbi:DsbA family protein [Granulicella rosea]|uniref:DsbA family protein n=1 Tax=Granulicella rosea TaxID=474952 RepID=UPI001FE8032B|nr:thioredoxin domain-containing protein [Granulicella rosea]